jgi:hypothetical protein
LPHGELPRRIPATSKDTVVSPSSGARRIIAGRADQFLVEGRSPSFPRLLLRFGKIPVELRKRENERKREIRKNLSESQDY